MRTIVFTFLLVVSLGFVQGTTKTYGAESLFRTAAKACVRDAAAITDIVNQRHKLSAEIEKQKQEMNGLSIKKDRKKYNEIQKTLTDLLYKSNSTTHQYETAVGLFQKACSGKTIKFDAYKNACKGKLENKFCTAFKAHHKKLSEMDDDSGMPPGIN